MQPVREQTALIFPGNAGPHLMFFLNLFLRKVLKKSVMGFDNHLTTNLSVNCVLYCFLDVLL